MLHRLFANATPAHAHCDLYCGVYDPAQAKIEALSCLKTLQKYADTDDEHFKTRAIIIKEQRAEVGKDHVLGVRAQGEGKVESAIEADGEEKLVKAIDEMADVFCETEKARGMGVLPPA